MKRFLIIAFFCVFGLRAFSQQNVVIWNERHPLQWIDFEGNVKTSSDFDAESFAEVKYDYTFISPKNFSFDVYASFNKNTSWCRKEYQSPELLKHEQVHFDIAELYAKRLQEVFDHFTYSKNFANEILQIFEQKKTEYHSMQMRYDDETNHSRNKQRQSEWEAFIKDLLAQLN